jgi:hypothetical protein
VNHSVLHYPSPTLSLSAGRADLISGSIGLLFAAMMVLFTRIAVSRTAWGARLHCSLRPVAEGLSSNAIIILAVFSSLGEELLFRSFLCPLIGVVAQGVLFGVAHQSPGRSRWVWIVWATVVGLALGLLYRWIGSIFGPLVAHAAINAVNLIYLRDYDPDCKTSR